MKSLARVALLLAGCLCVLDGFASAQTKVQLTGTTLSVGSTPTTPSGTTVRLGGLGTSGGTNVLIADSDGDVFARTLAVGDIPSNFTRRDVAEAISSAWSFSAGASFASVRGTSNPFVVRNTSNTRDLLQITDGGLLRVMDDASGSAYVDLNSTTAPSGRRFWRAGNFGGDFAVQSVNDGYSASSTLFTGQAVSGVATAFTFGSAVQTVNPATPLYSSLGSYLYPYSTLHVGELRASTFVVNETQAYTEASLKVGRGSQLSRTLPNGSTTLYTKTRFTKYLDFVILRGLTASGQPQFEVLQVNGAATSDCSQSPLPPLCGTTGADFAVNVARNQDGSGANDWPIGAAVVSMDRWIDIFSEASGVVGYGSTVLGDRPAVYWNFDDGINPTPNRASGPRGYSGARTSLTATVGNTGTAGGCWTGGCQGAPSGLGSFYYVGPVGSGSLTSAASPPEITTTAIAYSWSVEMVLYTGITGSGTGYAVQPVARWDVGNVNLANFVMYYFGDAAGAADGQVGMWGTFNGTWQNLTGVATLADGSWYHLIFTFDSYSGGKVYVNGVQAGAAASPAPGGALAGNTQPLHISGWRNGAEPYGTHLGELAIYDYQLGADAAAAHYAALHQSRPSTAFGPSVVGWVATGTNWYDFAPRWAAGNLSGLYDYATETYGFAAGNPATTWISADPASGFRIMSGTSAKFWADTTGNLALAGNLTLTTGGNILSANNYQITPSTGIQFARSSGAGSSIDITRALSIAPTLGGTPFFGIYAVSTNETRLHTASGSSLTIGDQSLSGFDDVSARVDINNNGSTSLVGSLGSSGMSFTASGILFRANASVSTSTHTFIRPEVDNWMTLGSATNRFKTAHFALPAASGSVPYVVVGDTTDSTRLGYIVGMSPNGVFIPVKNHAGTNCTITVYGGLVMSSTC